MLVHFDDRYPMEGRYAPTHGRGDGVEVYQLDGAGEISGSANGVRRVEDELSWQMDPHTNYLLVPAGTSPEALPEQVKTLDDR